MENPASSSPVDLSDLSLDSFKLGVPIAQELESRRAHLYDALCGMQRHLNGAEGIPGLLGTTQLLGTLLISRGTVDKMEEQIPDIVERGDRLSQLRNSLKDWMDELKDVGKAIKDGANEIDKILYGLNRLYGATMRAADAEKARREREAAKKGKKQTDIFDDSGRLIVENGRVPRPFVEVQFGTGTPGEPSKERLPFDHPDRPRLFDSEEGEGEGADLLKDDAPPALSPSLMDEGDEHEEELAAPQPIREMQDEKYDPEASPVVVLPGEKILVLVERTTFNSLPEEHREVLMDGYKGYKGSDGKKLPPQWKLTWRPMRSQDGKEFAGAYVPYEPAEPLMRTLEALKVAFQARSIKGDEPAKLKGRPGKKQDLPEIRTPAAK